MLGRRLSCLLAIVLEVSLYVTRAVTDVSVRCRAAGISETLSFLNESWEVGELNYIDQGIALDGQWLVLGVWKTYIYSCVGRVQV